MIYILDDGDDHGIGRQEWMDGYIYRYIYIYIHVHTDIQSSTLGLTVGLGHTSQDQVLHVFPEHDPQRVLLRVQISVAPPLSFSLSLACFLAGGLGVADNPLARRPTLSLSLSLLLAC